MEFRRKLGTLLLALAAAAGAAAYFLRVSPEVNAPLGLDRFDEGAIREKVLATSQRLLETADPLEVRLSQRSDTETLRRMQELFGFRATVHWTSQEVPVQSWVYRVYGRRTLSLRNPLAGPPPLLEAEVSSSGQILALTIPPRKEVSPQHLTAEEALEASRRLLRVLGVDVGELTLVSTRTGEEESRQTFDFTWKQPVRGLPGLTYQFTIQLQSGYLTSFHKRPLLVESDGGDVVATLVAPLLSGGVWVFLALSGLFLLVQKLRRDEVDVGHAQKVALAAGALTLARFLTLPAGGPLETVLAATLLALLAALFFALVWAAAESFLRSSFGELLRDSDLLLGGHLAVRETARRLLGAAALGTALLWVPVVFHGFVSAEVPTRLTFMPSTLDFSNLRFPGGLLGNALLGPLPGAFLTAVPFLGILYPFLKSRFSTPAAWGLFSLLFGIASAPLSPYGPPAAAGIAGLLAGAVLFFSMERTGLVGALLTLLLPQALSNTALLLTSRLPSVLLQGWTALGLLAAAALGLFYAAVFGRPASALRSYEPDYLARLRERERFARELEIAKGLQERFLPKTLPHIPGFSLATACVPAMEVGGDTFDFLPLPGGRWLLLVGDISGKGVKAAFYMTLIKGLLHALALGEGDHREILRRLNALFRSQSEPGTFLTLLAVILHPPSRSARIVSAGHNPPFLLTATGPTLLSPRGLVLGLMGDEAFLRSLEEVEITMRPGETLLLYTDGVTEAMNRDCEEYGMDRLRLCLERVLDLPPARVVEAVLEDVARFRGEARQADDLTLLAVSCHGS
ncbi:MAG: PP2C family protein-serine/threonine phosphatase [Acidobacteriota bacterium]